MPELTPGHLRSFGDPRLAPYADAWDAHIKRIDALERSWLALLREVSKLDRETTDWEGADDRTFLEEFDPWDVLRSLAPNSTSQSADDKEAR